MAVLSNSNIRFCLSQQEKNDKKRDKFTILIFLLYMIVVGTFCPLIYTYLPILGKIRIVMISSLILLPIYLVTASSYKNKDVYINLIYILQLTLLIIIIFSIMPSYDRGQTYSQFTVNLKYFLWFAVMVKIIDSDRRFDQLITIYSLCGVIMALSVIINYLNGKTFIDNELGVTYRASSIESGIFADPNDLALFLNTCLPYLLYFLLKVKRKIIPITCITVTIIAIVLTYSRGGFIGLCAVGLSFFLFIARTRKIYILLFLINIILFFVLTPDAYKERLSTIMDEVDNQAATPTRMDGWALIFRMNLVNQLFGVGAGCSYYLAGNLMSDWHSIHSSFFQIFADLGITGFTIYFLLYFVSYKQLKIITQNDYPELFKIRAKIIIMSFLSYGFTAFFLPQGYSPILYMLTAFAIIQNELSKRKDELNE